MGRERYQLDLRFAGREPRRLFLQRSNGSWRSESEAGIVVEGGTVPVSGAQLRIELSQDDGFDLGDVNWCGDVQDFVGALVAVSDELPYEHVTVNDEEWQWMSARADETLAVLTPSLQTAESVAKVRWFSEGGMTSSSAVCRLLRYGRWVLDWSWNDDGLPQGTAFRPSGHLQPSDVADWIIDCDLGPGRMGDPEGEALSLTVEFDPSDDAVLLAVLGRLPKVAMPGWSINGTRYEWNGQGQRWHAIG